MTGQSSASRGQQLTPFTTHLKQTRQHRRRNAANKTLVAPALRKYQDTTVWPRSRSPLPDAILDAVKKRSFRGLQTSALPWSTILFMNVLFTFKLSITLFFMTILLFAGGFPNVSGALPFLACMIVFVVLLFLLRQHRVRMLACCQTLLSHLRALHMLYVDAALPVGDSKRIAYRLHIELSLIHI